MDQNGGNNDFQYTGTAPPAPAIDARPEAPALNVSEHPVQWQASEFIDHKKSTGWLGLLALAIVAVAAVMYLLTKDILSSVVILVAGLAFGVFATQKPRTLSYSLMATTIKVGQKQYSYDDFRTFSIMQDGPIPSIFLEPTKRFMPPLTIYFGLDDAEKIFDTLAAHLPHQERQMDTIDRFMNKIRF